MASLCLKQQACNHYPYRNPSQCFIKYCHKIFFNAEFLNKMGSSLNTKQPYCSPVNEWCVCLSNAPNGQRLAQLT